MTPELYLLILYPVLLEVSNTCALISVKKKEERQQNVIVSKYFEEFVTLIII